MITKSLVNMITNQSQTVYKTCSACPWRVRINRQKKMLCSKRICNTLYPPRPSRALMPSLRSIKITSTNKQDPPRITTGLNPSRSCAERGVRVQEGPRRCVVVVHPTINPTADQSFSAPFSSSPIHSVPLCSLCAGCTANITFPRSVSVSPRSSPTH